jgi:hypothetical protein
MRSLAQRVYGWRRINPHSGNATSRNSTAQKYRKIAFHSAILLENRYAALTLLCGDFS